MSGTEDIPGETGNPECTRVHADNQEAGVIGAGTPVRGARGARAVTEVSQERTGSQEESKKEGLDGIDPAIADALKAPKNRQTVLRFEEDVITFLQSGEEALFFPLSLSGYQRLLAHRTAQYHGLQTATVDDGGDDHGKIKATKALPSLEAKPRLADVKVPDPPEEHKEQQKGGRRKGADRQLRREREASGAESFRAGSYRAAMEHRARERRIDPVAGAYGAGFPGMFPGQYPGAHPAFAVQSMTPGGQSALSGQQDLDYRRATRRARSFSESSESEVREDLRPHATSEAPSPGGQARGPSTHSSLDMSAAHMLASMSLHGEQVPGGVMHPGLGYPHMQIPFAYVPGAGGVPQAVPNLQGLGVYGSPPVPFGGYGLPYGYVPGRPGQQFMAPIMGQPVSPGMLQFYPGFVPQGYAPVPALPMQTPGAPFSMRQGEGPASYPQQSLGGGGLGQRRVSAPAVASQSRLDSGFSSTSTLVSQQQPADSAGSSESVSGEASPPELRS